MGPAWLVRVFLVPWTSDSGFPGQFCHSQVMQRKLSQPQMLLATAIVVACTHLALGQSVFVAPYTFSTYAGGLRQSPGSNDGPRNAARFYQPTGIALDANGNVFVADSGNHTVRQIGRDGIVRTIAGVAQVKGSADGNGTNARFDTPYGVALDKSGNLYVTDRNNCTVRKIGPDGTVSTVAGLAGVSDQVDGIGSSARFLHPEGIAIGNDGTIYVGDGVLRTISPTGLVRTFHTIGANGVTIAPNGNLFTTISVGNIIQRVASDGSVTTVAGVSESGGPDVGSSPPPNAGTTDALSTQAYFFLPKGIAIDASGNLFIADSGYSKIRRIAPNGSVTTLGGNGDIGGATDGIGNVAQFNTPTGVAVDSAGRVYIADRNNHAIRLGEAAPRGRLTNLSARARSDAGENALIAGFVVDGADTLDGTKCLIRAIGPTLTSYGVSGAVADPTLDLRRQETNLLIASNNDWGGDSTLLALGNSVGAFPLSPISKDSGLVVDATKGVYSAQINGTGIALAEIYDTSRYSPGQILPRLSNLSCRALVGSGDNVLIGGFVIEGPSPVAVLIRAIGPTLANFGVTNPLTNPKLELTRNENGSDVLVYSNDDWSGRGQIASFSTIAGAFPFANASTRDAAMIVTLNPGVYSARVSGVGGSTGVALVEIYEVR